MHVLIHGGNMVQLDREFLYNIGTVKDIGFDPKVAAGMTPKTLLYSVGNYQKPNFKNVSVPDPFACVNYNSVMGYDSEIASKNGSGAWWIADYKISSKRSTVKLASHSLEIGIGKPLYLQEGDDIILGCDTASPYEMKFRFFKDGKRGNRTFPEQ